jgi:23S rRNA pseudouridine1911/1915/1917 synthase
MDWSDALEVLYEDNHLVAVNKPCGWPSAHFDGQTETVDRLVKDYLREKYNKPGNVFLGVVHRLDRPVSGVLVFARTSKAAARLSEQFRENAVEKTYWAVTEAIPPDMAGTLTDHLVHDDEAMRARVTTATTRAARRRRCTTRSGPSTAAGPGSRSGRRPAASTRSACNSPRAAGSCTPTPSTAP